MPCGRARERVAPSWSTRPSTCGWAVTNTANRCRSATGKWFSPSTTDRCRPTPHRILDLLASECVKATFFMVGRMARGYPSLVHRAYNEGHTIANHSQNHPFTFHKMTVDQASQEIEDGFASLRTVLGDPKAVAPFFRIPGLLRQEPVEQYLASRGYMTWSVDFLADDWTRIKADEIARRASTDGSQGSWHHAAARHPARHRPGAADHLARAQGARLQGRARAAGNAGSPENGDRAGAMGAAGRPACQLAILAESGSDRQPGQRSAHAGCAQSLEFRPHRVAGRRRSEGRGGAQFRSRINADGRRAAAIGGAVAGPGELLWCRPPRRTSCRCRAGTISATPASSGCRMQTRTKLATRKPAATTAGPTTASTPAPAKPKDPAATGSVASAAPRAALSHRSPILGGTTAAVWAALISAVRFQNSLPRRIRRALARRAHDCRPGSSLFNDRK